MSLLRSLIILVVMLPRLDLCLRWLSKFIKLLVLVAVVSPLINDWIFMTEFDDLSSELKSLDIDPETISLLVEYAKLKRQLVVINARLDNVKQLIRLKDIK